jgi:ppGpp synthetase/RelA/SpoT-type nucleotidyltranferase
MSPGSESSAEAFDFVAHRHSAESAYQRVRHTYEGFAECLRSVLRLALDQRGIHVATIDPRAKAIESFGRKAAIPDESDPLRPKYPRPLEQITDMAGVRVITFFPKIVDEVNKAIAEEFEVLERVDKGAALLQEERFGYTSVHYIIRLAGNRTRLPEYAAFSGLVGEIQVRTALQHAWAEIEHDIQYKSAETIPTEISRRLMALAGLLEIADREFQAIQIEDERLRRDARRLVDEGRLNDAELTPDSLKAYLDKTLGPDGRMADWSYDYQVRDLRRLGFRTLGQVDECVKGYDDDRISRLVWGSRQGQLTRFDLMVLAGMGEQYLRRHRWNDQEWFIGSRSNWLGTLRTGGVEVREYVPE